MPEVLQRQFEATPEKGRVSACVQMPANAVATLVLGHGAGADMRHAHMQALADALAEAGIATLRFNFPFREAGVSRVDSKPACIDTIAGAVALAREHDRSGLVLAGGHSFGGRMASHYAVETDPAIRGLIYFSFPLHPANKPGTDRAQHMTRIAVPQLFLSGTRDALANLELLRAVIADLAHAQLYELDTADHSFKILKRSRTSDEDVYTEAARVAREFIDNIKRD